MTKAVTQWAAGQSGNPKGRPKDVRNVVTLRNNLELAVREKLTPAIITRVVNRLVEIATSTTEKATDVIAAGREIIRLGLDKKAQEAAGMSKQFTIVIQNTSSGSEKPAIDVQYKEVTRNEEPAS